MLETVVADFARPEPPRRETMNSVNSEKFAHAAHSVGVSKYHLQWVTKCRYKTLLKESHYKDCEESIKNVAARHSIELLELGVMPDHVHMIVFLPPEMSISKAINLLKGASSHDLFQLHPNFRLRYPQGHFWGRGYFYRSVSNVDDETVSRYVREDNDPRQRRLN